MSTPDFPNSPALVQREEVVVPYAVRIGPDVFAVGSFDDADIGSFAAHARVERVRLRLDGVNDFRARPLPVHAAEVSDSLVRIVARQLVDAGDLDIGHDKFSSSQWVLDASPAP